MRVLTVAIAAAFSIFATPAPAAEGVGEVKAVTGSITATRAGDDPRQLIVGSQVYIDDLVSTNAVGEAQLQFDNCIRITVGHNTTLGIDEFLDGEANKRITFDSIEGNLRAIMGEDSKECAEDSNDAYEPRFAGEFGEVIPRGTAFDLSALPDRPAKLLLLKGKAKLCSKGGDCKAVETKCGLLVAEPGKKVEEIEAGKRRVQEIRADFPFLTSQSRLLEPFRIEGHGCADGGVAPFALDQPEIVVPVVGVSAVILCILFCFQGDPPTSPPSTN